MDTLPDDLRAKIALLSVQPRMRKFRMDAFSITDEYRPDSKPIRQGWPIKDTFWGFVQPDDDTVAADLPTDYLDDLPVVENVLVNSDEEDTFPIRSRRDARGLIVARDRDKTRLCVFTDDTYGSVGYAFGDIRPPDPIRNSTIATSRFFAGLQYPPPPTNCVIPTSQVLGPFCHDEGALTSNFPSIYRETRWYAVRARRVPSPLL